MDLAAPILPVDPELFDRFAALERHWVRTWVSAVPYGQREALGLRYCTIDDGNDVVACDALPHMICNRVLGHGLADARAMTRAIAALRPDNALLVLGCGDGVATQARTLGLQPFRRDSQVLVRGTSLAAHVPVACRIERADRRHVEAIASIFSEAFALPQALGIAIAHAIERPSVHGYLAFDGDTAVAAALMLVDRHHAYLAGGAT
ncbi:MAG: hypothetical protein IAG13_22610, partial [Deltaproteobacteria bacterium]|nr:hypothetical protein [Nannocystaceae bacterium]